MEIPKSFFKQRDILKISLNESEITNSIVEDQLQLLVPQAKVISYGHYPTSESWLL